MERRFFDLEIDVYVPGRWYLAEPMDLADHEVPDVWAFRRGGPIEDPGPLRIPIDQPGRPLDYSTADVGMTPILSARAAAVFREWAPRDVQLFQVEVQGQAEPYFLMNVARTVQCIDEAACAEVQRYTVADGRPERIGRYRAVHGLRIDKSKVGEERVFLPWGWRPALIVEGALKEALERTGCVGALFIEV